jgi:hypothetical protein
MTVRILLDSPRRPAGPRLARILAILTGLPIIGVGVICLYVMGVLVLLSFDSPGATAKQQLQTALIAIAFTIVALACLWLGLRLLRGKRRLVLFLRRFGFSDATQAVSFAATKAIGRSWRLVTLDDEKVKAVGGPATGRRLAIVTAAFALALLISCVWEWVHIPSINSLTQQMMAAAGTPGKPANLVEAAQELEVGLAATLAIMADLFGTVFWASAAGISVLLLIRAYVLAIRAERAKAIRVGSQRDVRDRSQAITRRASRIFAPRLVVATVANAFWQQAVQSFARASAVVIIDVSVPSENLRWEINTLLPIMGQKCILVGCLDLLAEQHQDGQAVFTSPLECDIDGHDVLAYRPDKSGVQHFSRALKATIEVRTRTR